MDLRTVKRTLGALEVVQTVNEYSDTVKIVLPPGDPRTSWRVKGLSDVIDYMNAHGYEALFSAETKNNHTLVAFRKGGSA